MSMNAVFGRSLAPFVAAMVLLVLACPRPGLATMPAAPLDVSFDFGGPVAVGADVTVTLRARPLMDAPSLSLSITLPDGVDLVSGQTTWEGAARAGDVRTLTVTIRPQKAAPAVIQGAAMLKFADGTTLGGARSLMLPLGDPSKHKLNLPPPKKTKTGESVIEYRDEP